MRHPQHFLGVLKCLKSLLVELKHLTVDSNSTTSNNSSSSSSSDHNAAADIMIIESDSDSDEKSSSSSSSRVLIIPEWSRPELKPLLAYSLLYLMYVNS